MNISKKRILSLTIISILIIFVSAIYLIMRSSVYSARLDIEVSPSNSTISINGKKVKEGVIRVKPGEVNIVVQRDRFGEETKDVKVSKNEVRYVGFVLLPNSSSTSSWYNEHPEDLKKAEGISSKSFDESSESAVSDLPFILKLPYLGPGLGYRIDYGGGTGEDNKPVIYIKAKSEEDKSDALNWMKNQGVDPNTLRIVFQ